MSVNRGVKNLQRLTSSYCIRRTVGRDGRWGCETGVQTLTKGTRCDFISPAGVVETRLLSPLRSQQAPAAAPAPPAAPLPAWLRAARRPYADDGEHPGQSLQ